MSIDKGWDARGYQSRHAYVFEHGEALIDLLDPQPGERILDLGCGAGQLSAKIAARGAHVIGLDLSPEMIAQAAANFPKNGATRRDSLHETGQDAPDNCGLMGNLEFRSGDAADFEIDPPVDAVFSNAVLHWVSEAAAAIRCVHRALKPGGRFVMEMGGKGNVRALLAAINEAAGQALPSPWFFPSVSEYASLLESSGFEVGYAALFDRPTQVAGEDGLEDWLKMFGGKLLREFSDAKQREIRAEVARKLRGSMFSEGNALREGSWTLDYRRLRILARKV